MDAGVELLRRGNRALTALHYRVPFADRLAEAMHFELARRTVVENLGREGQRAFRGMA